MASPATTSPVSQRHIRSLAGPLVLIILGITFLLGTLGVIDWRGLADGFGRFWPLLLILWGVVKYSEYRRAEKLGIRSPGIGVGGVFLMIFIIGVGLVATQASRVNWTAVRDQLNVNDGDFPLFGHTYNYEQTMEQDFPAGASLRVLGERGAVSISVSEDNKIHITAHKRINAEKQEVADHWNESTRPLLTVSDHTVSLNANTQGAGDHWIATDLDISMPRNAPVMVSTRRGDVSVLGRVGDVQISSQKGDVSASDINGKLSLTLDHSSARISQVTGDVAIDGKGNVNDVSLADVKGAVRLNGDFMESVSLSKIGKSVSFKSPRTELELSKLDGDLELDSGDLQASNLIGPLRLITRSKDIRLDGVSGDVRLQNENGAVELRLVKPGSMQVENRRGNIEIYLPDKFGFQLDARARNGEVQSDFTDVKVSNTDEQATATGTIGGGGPHLVINNDQGTIEIRKRSSLAMTPPEPPPPGRKAPMPPPPSGVEPTEN